MTAYDERHTISTSIQQRKERMKKLEREKIELEIRKLKRDEIRANIQLIIYGIVALTAILTLTLKL